MASLYISTQTFSDFQEEVTETWGLDEEYNLIDVEYIGGRWTGVLADNGVNNANAVETAEDSETLASEIQEYWDEGYDLIDIEYIDETWIAVFDNSQLFGGTRYNFSADSDEFVEETQEFFDAGYQLANVEYVEYGDGYWVSIFDRSDGRSALNRKDSLTGLEEAIETRKEEGFDLVGVEYAQETWVGVFKEAFFSNSAYSITSDRGEFNQSLEEFTEAGYDLIDFERVDDQWIGVYEQKNPNFAELGRTSDSGLRSNLGLIEYGPAINIPTPG
ncbi:MAG: hypothetical protein AAFQ14_11140 [Cyanobacteria bacterium J06621_12]